MPFPKIAHTLPGLHAFTGCDIVSAFAGKGKLTALKIVKDSPKFQRAFTLLGERFDVTNELLTTLEEFVCRLYGSKTVKTVRELRYTIFCAKSGVMDSHHLPPSHACLQKHILLPEQNFVILFVYIGGMSFRQRLEAIRESKHFN